MIGVSEEQIARWPGIGLAEPALHAPGASFEGVELYPDVLDKAVVLCVRLARNHPLSDGSKRVAYLALPEFLARNDIEWLRPSVDATVATIERVAAGTIAEASSGTGCDRRGLGLRSMRATRVVVRVASEGEFAGPSWSTRAGTPARRPPSERNTYRRFERIGKTGPGI